MCFGIGAPLIIGPIVPSQKQTAKAAEAGVGAPRAGLSSVNYSFEVGKLPISTRIRVFREFDVQNRFEGTAGYFTVSLPVGIDTNAKAVPGKMIRARF